MGDVMAVFVEGRAAISPDRAGSEANTGFMRFEALSLGEYKEGIPRMEKCERSGYNYTLCEGLP